MVFEKVKALIADMLDIDADKITENSDLIDELEADSLDIVQMLIAMESEFSLEFDEDEITSLRTIGDIVSFIEKKKK